jgi:carboxyl-terminal processing protease
VSAAICLGIERSTPGSALPSPALRNQAQIFATQLQEILQLIARKYVRPVSRGELAEASLRGLYEAARVPVPATLHTDVQHATAVNQLHQFFAQCREQLGNIETVRGTQALYSSLQALTRKLDPYSTVVRKDKLPLGDGTDATSGFGLELTDSQQTGLPTIKAVIPGGPAQKAGLRPGDRITHIRGQPVTQPHAAAEILQMDRLDVRVVRPSTREERQLLLKRSTFKAETVLGVRRHPDDSWDFFLDVPNRIAQVRLAALAPGTSSDLQQVLQDLQAADLRGLILDLRWCPGGWLRESVQIADLFLSECNLSRLFFPSPATLLTTHEEFLGEFCVIATVKYRDDRVEGYSTRVEGHSKKGKRTYVNFPMVVLVNGETSGGAELIAAALQDNRRARIAGQRTLGKASVQSPLDLQTERSLTLPVTNLEIKLSSGTFLRPSGLNMHRFPESAATDSWGVLPDPSLDSRVSAALSQQLREWWTWQTLRPALSEEALPLDDPTLDPQRWEAWQVLLGLLKHVPAAPAKAAP